MVRRTRRALVGRVAQLGPVAGLLCGLGAQIYGASRADVGNAMVLTLMLVVGVLSSRR
jgi:hypothetical protein